MKKSTHTKKKLKKKSSDDVNSFSFLFFRANDWMPILNTLRINKSLEFVAVRSYYTPPTDDNGK